MFAELIQEIETTGYSEPMKWLAYQEEYCPDSKKRTQEVLAVDDLKKLDASLRDHGYMIFRLGTHGRQGAHFSIVRYREKTEQFIFNADLIGAAQEEVFRPTVPAAELRTFAAIPNATENGLVNLAIASGVMGQALELSGRPTLPARGCSTYSFDLWPSRSLPGLRLEHSRGQVEIDAAFTGNRDGEEVVCVVEAKRTRGRTSIAKAKLAYSYLAVASQLPAATRIELVYLLMDHQRDQGTRFLICPCRWDGRFVSDIEPNLERIVRYLLPHVRL